MRCFRLLAGVILSLAGTSGAAAQNPEDTLPVRVVERMLDASNRGDQTTRSTPPLKHQGWTHRRAA